MTMLITHPNERCIAHENCRTVLAVSTLFSHAERTQFCGKVPQANLQYASTSPRYIATPDEELSAKSPVHESLPPCALCALIFSNYFVGTITTKKKKKTPTTLTLRYVTVDLAPRHKQTYTTATHISLGQHSPARLIPFFAETAPKEEDKELARRFSVAINPRALMPQKTFRSSRAYSTLPVGHPYPTHSHTRP